ATAATHSSSALALLWPFSSPTLSPEATACVAVAQIFSDGMAALSANMVHLILEAETALCQLEHLKAYLGTLHKLVAHEDSALAGAKVELLAALWT
ncbi:hypothetical protein OF83DRAFT_1179035, partial [Amylostereum chailletii]